MRHKTRRILSLCLLSTLFCLDKSSFACMKDEETIRKAWEIAATKKTFSTTGYIMMGEADKFPKINSGVLLDEQTVLTCAHQLYSSSSHNAKTYFSLDTSYEMPFYNAEKTTLDMMLSGLKPATSSEVGQVIIHPLYDESFISSEDKYYTSDFNDFLSYARMRHDEQYKIDIVLKSEIYSDFKKKVGPDLAILKLKRPIHHQSGFLSLAQEASEKNTKAFSVGYPLTYTCNGNSVKTCLQRGEKDELFWLNQRLSMEHLVEFHPGTHHLYELHLSPASRDNMFCPVSNLKYGGLISYGMSGGPLISHNPKTNRFEIIGISSRVSISCFYDVLEQKKKDVQSPELSLIIENIQKELMSKNTPVYNIWEPVHSYIEWLDENR